jgi:hypothetical protein
MHRVHSDLDTYVEIPAPSLIEEKAQFGDMYMSIRDNFLVMYLEETKARKDCWQMPASI